MTKGHFLSGTIADLNSRFSFSWIGCITEAKEPSLFYYLIVGGEKRNGFMPFLRALT